ncbi:MAG: DUF2953 domain-containing protein [Firmicutes bacterium]|nr:DUF2953 domain-containing protein [Bacillota bacterium]
MYLHIGLAFAILIGIILFVPFRLVLSYRLLHGDDDLHLQVIWLGTRLAKLRVPILSSVDIPSDDRSERLGRTKQGDDVQADQVEQMVGWRQLMDNIETIHKVSSRYRVVLDTMYMFAYGKLPNRHHMPLGQPVLGYLAASVYPFTRHCEVLHWYTRIGLGDAAATAIAVGTLSGLKAVGLSWFQQRVHIESNQLHWQVIPNYSQRQVDIVLDCILRVNAGHIIITGAMNLLRVGIRKVAFWRSPQVQ